MNPKQEAQLRQVFKYFNQFMLLMWRLGLGKWLNAWPEKGGQIMVITHIGRRSGLQRRTPVNYALIDGDLYCTAGFGHVSDWYRNMKVNPNVEIWLPDGWWDGIAEDVSDAPNRLSILRQVLISSGFAAEMAGIHPKTMSDTELDAQTTSYKLVRIQHTAARTGPGGPNDLNWVWPLAMILLLSLTFRRKRKPV